MSQDKTTADIERQAALDYHEFPRPGKLEIRPTKPMATGLDLARAYSPGVAEACTEIAANPLDAVRYTAKGNLVAVITNGTAVLGLGNIGAQASKPVMEGKAVLFKKFAGLDCFDIEVNEADPEALADLVCKLEPTFGAVNLEDIKAPDCFIVERICRERMNIPVFHDDQHGTAIVVAAAATNALQIVGKKAQDIRVVGLGAGAAGIACHTMLRKMGVPVANTTLFDKDGVLHPGRTDLCPEQMDFANADADLTLEEALKGADLFLGLSGPGLLPPKLVGAMAPNPIIFALANPTPEIMPDEARAASPGAMIATGRSDFPNQVNNVLCFPFILSKCSVLSRPASRRRLVCEATPVSVMRSKMSAFWFLLPKPRNLEPELRSTTAEPGMRSEPSGRRTAVPDHRGSFMSQSGLGQMALL